MKILVIGSGGREHALAWKLAQSPTVEHVYVAPGNAGTHREPKVENVEIDPLDFAQLADFAKHHFITFTVVGPEAPLVEGIVDYFEEKGLLCLGPSQKAAQLEGSKIFAKHFMQTHGIPTAGAQTFQEKEAALAYLQTAQFPIVIKADGLAAGKGVVIAQNFNEAALTIENLQQSILIEDFIVGEELSYIVLADGNNFIPFAPSQDHKTRDDGDKGPNTGGMGAYSPPPIATAALEEKIIQQVIVPTLNGMAKEGAPFKGFLYAGLMVTPQGDIRVLEFNCRFGDPETQPILMRLISDFAIMCQRALEKNLSDYSVNWDPKPAIGVVLAARGYPDYYVRGETIPHLNEIPPSADYKIFHAGTKIEGSRVVSNGGRVLCVTATGDDLKQAQDKAYKILKKIAWEGGFYRQDIGHRALK